MSAGDFARAQALVDTGRAMVLFGPIIALAAFDPGQPLPEDFPERTALACGAAAFMLVARAAVEYLADPSSHWIWFENALNLALIGSAWVVADSLALKQCIR